MFTFKRILVSAQRRGGQDEYRAEIVRDRPKSLARERGGDCDAERMRGQAVLVREALDRSEIKAISLLHNACESRLRPPRQAFPRRALACEGKRFAVQGGHDGQLAAAR